MTDQQRSDPFAAVTPEPPHAAPVGVGGGDASAASSGGGDARRPIAPFAVLALAVVCFLGGVLLDRAVLAGADSRGPVTPDPRAGLATTPPPATSRPPASPSPDRSLKGSPAPTPTPRPSPSPLKSVPANAPPNFGLFFEALRIAQENFVDKSALTPTNITYGAITGMLNALGDVGHTGFLTPEEVRSTNEGLQGKVTGIGAFLGERDEVPIIQSVIRGGPAERAGLRSGDTIISVDGERVTQLRPDEIASRIRGEAGTTVRIEVIHRGESEPVTVNIVREEVSVPAVSWARVPGSNVILLQLSQFSSDAGEGLRRALQEGLRDGADGVVLDLRGNPGGFTEEAVQVASQFLASGNVYLLSDRDGKRTAVPVRPGGVATEVRLVVLVDEGTASSAEIVTGALQDADRAQVVGVPTAGTGTVLNTFPLSDGSAVRIGVQQWLTPNGERIFGKGITPDVRLAVDPDADLVDPQGLEQMTQAQLRDSGDVQLLKALELLGVRP